MKVYLKLKESYLITKKKYLWQSFILFNIFLYGKIGIISFLKIIDIQNKLSIRVNTTFNCWPFISQVSALNLIKKSFLE